MKNHITNLLFKCIVLCIVLLITTTDVSAQSCFGATAPKMSFTSSGGTLQRTIQHNCSGGTFSIGGYPSWITSISVSGNVVTATAPAYSGQERSGSIQLLYNGNTTGGILAVQNEGQAPPPPPPPPCTVSGFTGGSYNPTGETKSYMLSYSNCSSQGYFNFEDGSGNPLPSWITISQPSTTQVNVTFAANNTGSARSLVIVGTRQDGQQGGIGNTFSQACATKTWYPDSDGDGFRNPTGSTQQSCSQPSGNWTDNSTIDNCPNDYNLTNISQTWYADSDGDGFRDPGGATITQCSEPSGNWTNNSTVDNCPSQYYTSNNGCDPNCYTIALSPPQLDFSEIGGSSYSDITFPNGCTNPYDITLHGIPSWFTATLNGNRVNVSCNSYTGSDGRQATIQIKVNGNTSGGLLITQDAPPPPPPPPCTVSGFNGSSFDSTGETKSYTLTYSNCPSQSFFDFEDENGNPLPSWITISQSSTTQVSVTFAANNTASARSVVIVGVRQDGQQGGIGGTFSQDCNPKTWYADSDGDGFRDPGSTAEMDCSNRGTGWTQNTEVDNCPNEYYASNGGCIPPDPDCAIFTVTPSPLVFNENGGTQYVDVNISADCTDPTVVTYSNKPDWLTLTVNGNQIQVDCQESSENRTVNISVFVNGNSGGGFVVEQNGTPPPPPPPTESCAADPIENIEFGTSADTATVSVTYSGDCNGTVYLVNPMTMEVPNHWLSISKSGLTFTLSVNDNDTGNPLNTYLIPVLEDVQGNRTPIGQFFEVTQTSCSNVWYQDTDGDGLGDPNVTLVQCEQPPGYVPTPDVDSPISEDSLPDLSGLDTQDMNTTFTVEPYTPVTSLSQIDALPANGKMASRTYYDGMARPVQEVALHAGGISYEGYTGNDIVSYIEYDRFGRAVKQFSPYGKLDQAVAGDFEPMAQGEQIQFYAAGNLQNSFVQTANPFSETVFDRSPRNRAIRQASPGDNWSIASGHEVGMGYFFNAQDEVRYFRVDLDNDLIPTLVADDHYVANELIKTVVRDENWTSGVENTAEEFVNKDGQTVLKRTHVGGEALSTYYVYDDYGNLTYVLPPKAEPDTAAMTNAVLNSLAFQYRYDALRRQVEKRNPGVDGWERIVYDYEDRPILAQDANMALNDQWLFTKYDKFGRPVYTGFFNSTQSRAELQQLADNWVAIDQKPYNEQRMVATNPVGGTAINYSNEAFPDSNLELLSINYYDDYDIVDSDLPITPTVVLGQNVTTNAKGLATISWVKVLDGQPNSWNKTYTFYDERARALRVQTKNFQQGFTIVDNALDFRGKVVERTTGHRKDFLDAEVNIRDTYTYDHMERIRTQSQALYDGSFIGGTLIKDNIVSGFLYDALGQLTKKYIEPESDGFGWQMGLDESMNPVEMPNSNDPAIVVSREFNLGEPGIYDVSYDFSGDTSGVAYSLVLAISRGSTLVYRENLTATELGNTINFVAATSGTYTVELSFRSPNGSFIADSNFTTTGISLAPNTTLPEPSTGLAHKDVPALQVVDYQYNARGSMTQINDVDDLQSDLFAYRMHYDDPTVGSGAAPMYNGNIAQVQWKTQNDGVLRGYGYAYDALSRLTSATDNTGNYNISNISYDKNGNLLTLHRKGWGQFNGSNTFGDIDLLDYSSYDGNKLLKVVDGGNATEGFRYNSAASVDYTFDANGNMISDANKGIALIEYNYLDLPETVTFANGDEIRYLYDAMGTKLKKTAILNNNPTITEYWNGFQYQAGELQFFAQPEGYVAVGETAGQRTFDLVYHYTDHLGNVRLSYSDMDGNGSIDATTEIINENNYYPFGMLHKGYNTGVHPLGTGYTYGFNGKELQEDGDLAWLDFGSRNYDPALGRWMNIDPQAGRYVGISPFAAMGNNPVTFADPNGEELVTSLIIGAVAGAVIGGTTTAIFTEGADFGDILGGALIGAFSGVVTAGIGDAFAGAPGILEKGGLLPGLGQAGTHALFQGSLSAAQGGNFLQGAATAAAASVVGSVSASGGPVAQVTMGAFTGGATSLLTGGSFEQGFATGLTVSALNHALHSAVHSNKNQENPCPKCPKLTIKDQIEMMEAHRQGMSYVSADGEGNYLYYHPDGSIEYSTTSPGMKALQLGTSTMLFEFPLQVMKGLYTVFSGKGGKELFNFSSKAAKHFADPSRKVPLQIMDEVIKGTKGLPDPRGSKALMHYSTIFKNGKQYNLEILYDKATNSIWHFKYSREAMGPLQAIPK